MLPKNELNKIAEISKDIICTIDKEGTFVWINNAVERILGYKPSEVIGTSYLDYVHKDDRKRTKEVTEDFLEGRQVQNFVTRYHHKDQSIVTIEWAGSWDETDQLYYCIARDQTDYIKTKENYRNLFHQSPLPKYVYDLQTLEFVDMNQAALDLYKYSKKDLPNLTLFDLRPEREHKNLKTAIGKYYRKAGSGRINFGVFNHQDKKGKRLKIDVTGQKIELNGRECAMVIGKDVTEEYRLSTYKQFVSDLSILFNQGLELTETVGLVLKYLVDKLNFDFGEVWLQGKENDHVKLIDSYPFDLESEEASESSESDIIKKFHSGVGLPGVTWLKKETIIWNESELEKNFVRLNAAQQSGIKTAIGVPLNNEKSIYGVLLFGSSKQNSTLEDESLLLKNLESFLGPEVHRKILEEDFNRIFETVPDVLCKIDFESSIKRINNAGSELLGYNEEELKKIKFTELVYEPDQMMVSDLLSKTNSLNENLDCEFRVKKKSGEVLWLSWSFNIYQQNGIYYAIAKDITSRKEQLLLIDSATDLAKIGGWELDLKTKKMYWSPMTRKIHGVEPDVEMDLNSGIKFYRKDYQTDVKKRYSHSEKTGETFEFEAPIVRTDGEERWIKCIGSVITKGNKPLKMVGSIQDIHERKIVQLENEKLLNERGHILESISDAFFAVDRKWVVTYWNTEAEQVLGTKSSEIVGKNLWEVYSDAIKLEFYHQYHKAMKTGEAVNFEEYYPTLNKWFDVSAYPSETGLSVFFKDVSIKRRKEEQMRRSNERFKKAAEATNDVIYDWDLEKQTLFLGEGFQKLFGYNQEELPNHLDTWKKYLHPDDAHEVVESLKKAIADKSVSKWEEEYRYIKSDGEIAHLIERGTIIRDEQGKGVRMVGAISDITERKQFERSLQKLNRELKHHAKELSISNAELEQFAYVASHDLQEPLRMITSFLSQLEKNYRDQLDEKAEKYIHYAVDGARRMRQIILDLLDFSRVGKNMDQLEEIDLNDLIDEICRLYKNRIDEHSAVINRKKLPVIYSHKTAIFQIFQNLISNSIKYSKEDAPPKVDIYAEEYEDVYQFMVRDNGIGIGKEYYDKVFILFQRLHGRDEYSGSGMGLAIVKKWIENLGGQIWLRSNEGEGSTFTFTIAKRKP